MLESLLDEIPQLGQSRRSALLEKFGSVTAIRSASKKEIAATPGIGEKIAAIIFDHLALIATEKIDMQTGEIHS